MNDEAFHLNAASFLFSLIPFDIEGVFRSTGDAPFGDTVAHVRADPSSFDCVADSRFQSCGAIRRVKRDADLRTQVNADVLSYVKVDILSYVKASVVSYVEASVVSYVKASVLSYVLSYVEVDILSYVKADVVSYVKANVSADVDSYDSFVDAQTDPVPY